MTNATAGATRQRKLQALLEAIDQAPVPAVPTAQSSSPTADETQSSSPTRLPEAIPVDANFDAAKDLRRSVLDDLREVRSEERTLSGEFRRDVRADADKGRVVQALQHVGWQREGLQDDLQEAFVPQHSPLQLISPQRLLMTRLFNVRPHKVPREEIIKLVLGSTPKGDVRYSGPELRQSDGLVFMALINMARDVRTGRQVSFLPKAVCEALHGSYNGKSRELLREAIFRLQHAVLRFPGFSVQLAQRFDYPQYGAWSVALDPQIVTLFVESRLVWMSLETRLSLPEGLCSWLYGYIEGQTTLIPQQTAKLKEMCGSDADLESFHVMLRRALAHLVSRGLVDTGWAIKKGVLHWRKPLPLPAAA